MNVLQVGFRDLAGQRFNGYQLHRSLRDLGHDARMLVLFKEGSDPSVIPHPPWVRLLERGLYASERISSLQGLLSPIALTFPLRDCFRRAQLVHWHLVYPHYISVPLMPYLARMRPTVWSLHDPWATTGHCIHPSECERWKTGCGKCPDLKRDFTVWFDTTRFTWGVKRTMFRKMPVTLVAPSRWIRGRIQASPLLSHLPCHVIHTALDLSVWRRVDRDACRARLGIPSDARVIAFRMPSGDKQQYSKGIPWIRDALHRLKVSSPTHLIVFQEKGHLTDLASKYTIHEVGWLNDTPKLVDALTAADVFLMPSVAETAPTMALEAMGCATPVIVSDTSAMPEMVRAPTAGIAIPVGSGEALTQAMEELLGNESARKAMGEAGRRIVESEHSLPGYAQRHLELYENLISERSHQR